MYSVLLSLKEQNLAEVSFKSITQVCKFLENVNFDLCDVEIVTNDCRTISADDLMEVWFNA